MDCLLLDNEAIAQSIDIGSHLKYSRPWSVILGQQLGSNTRLLDLRIVNEETTSLHDLCHIFDALKHNSTLKSLSIKDSAKQQTHPATNASNPTLKKETYAKNLENNKSLTSLSLINVQLSGNIQSLADAVSHNKTLQKLTILDNTLNEKDLKQLFDGLLFNTTLDGLNIPRSLSKSSIYLQLMSFVTKNQSNKLKNKEYVPPKQPTIDWDISKSLEKIEVSDVRASLENKAPHSIKQEIQEKNDDYNENGNNFSHKNQQDEAQMIIDQLVQQNELLRDQIDMLQTGGLERIAELDKYKEQNAWLIDENEKLRLEISMLRNTLDIKENGHGNRASLHDSYISSLGHDIPYRDIVLAAEPVGSGTYGDVFKAQWHGQNIAVKRIKLIHQDNARIDDLLHESRTVRRLHHKHIVMSMGTTVDPETTQIMLVMEYMKHGSLEDLLFKQQVKLQRAQIVQLALDIAKGLNYLHCLTPKIIHRDLKCANILLYHKKTRAKISDFGTARYLNQNSLAKTVHGTIGYIAPELFEDVQVRVDEASFKDGYNEKADVYSFGMVLLVLATCTPSVPTTRDPIELRNKIDSALRASISMADDEQFKQLVRDCCDINPTKRPSMKQCIDTLKSLRQIHYA